MDCDKSAIKFPSVTLSVEVRAAQNVALEMGENSLDDASNLMGGNVPTAGGQRLS